MTLRARLTAAFLAVVLGPVLVCAVVVGSTVTAVNRSRAIERLNLAASVVQSAVDALCQRLTAAARTAAVDSAAGRYAAAAQAVVVDGLADAVRLTDAAGHVLLVTPAAPTGRWVECGAGRTTDRTALPAVPTAAPSLPGGQVDGLGAGDSGPTAISAPVVMRDAAGTFLGYAEAAVRLNTALLDRLGTTTGTGLTLLDGGSLSTWDASTARRVADAAAGLTPGTVGRTDDGRYVRRLSTAAGQPLALAVSVPPAQEDGLRLALVLIVALAAAAAVAVARWLANTTTRPLADLASAAGRVAAGDLSARVPVRRPDEVGRLGETFNRMTREMRAYVEALTASRDQLRGHLGTLGDTLSSTHDLQRMLQVILRTAQSATGAQAGVVLLVDPVEGVLVGQCAHGLSGRGASEWPLRIPLGTGLLGSVAATGVSRRGHLGRDAPDTPELVAGEPRGRTYMAVPFAARRRADADPAHAVRGVLALYDRLGSDEFDDDDLVTLRNFAGQVAVAVENVRLHEEAQRLSHTDPLTGLSNYRTLRDCLRREVERANRFGHRLCVMVLDLDRFKEVNDSYGHAAGDAVLAEFARRLRGEIREVDLAFRQGGEEFVVLLPETDTIGGITVAERLGTAVRETAMAVTVRRHSAPGEHAAQPAIAGLPSQAGRLINGGEPPTIPGAHGPAAHGCAVPLRIPITVSVGVAVFPDHGGTGAAVIEAADEALYAAKAAGRDTYRLATAPAAAIPAGASVTPIESAQPGPHAPRQNRGR
jgi:two-component system, cell cycle response regulator